MGRIQTLRGSIQPEDLGWCDAHEHLIGQYPMGIYDPDYVLDSIDNAVLELSWFYEAGGRSTVDMSPIGPGRDVPSLLRIAERTPVHIIACTGFTPPALKWVNPWLRDLSEVQLTDLVVGEITEGMDLWNYSGPWRNRTSAKAGVIKVSTGYYSWTEEERRFFRIAAKAHAITGAPISTHTTSGTSAIEQADYLISLGVNPDKIIIGHIDRNPDPYLHEELAKRGVNLLYNAMGRIKYFPDNVIVSLVFRMVEKGYAPKLLFAGDRGRRSGWRAYGKGPGFTYLLHTFIPRLLAEGLPREVVDQITQKNPARIFSF